MQIQVNTEYLITLQIHHIYNEFLNSTDKAELVSAYNKMLIQYTGANDGKTSIYSLVANHGGDDILMKYGQFRDLVEEEVIKLDIII